MKGGKGKGREGKGEIGGERWYSTGIACPCPPGARVPRIKTSKVLRGSMKSAWEGVERRGMVQWLSNSPCSHTLDGLEELSQRLGSLWGGRRSRGRSPDHKRNLANFSSEKLIENTVLQHFFTTAILVYDKCVKIVEIYVAKIK